MQKIALITSAAWLAFALATPVLAVPYADVEGNFAFNRLEVDQNVRADGRFLLVTGYGELNVQLNRNRRDGAEVIERNCNYVFEKTEDTAEALELILVPNSATTNSRNSSAECADTATLQVTDVSDQAVRATFADDMNTFTLSMARWFGSAYHDTSPYASAIAGADILGATLATMGSELQATVALTDDAYESVEGRDTVEMFGDDWRLESRYLRKPPAKDERDRDVDVDSLAIYYETIARDASYDGSERPTIMKRILRIPADQKMSQTALAAALEKKYGAPSFDRTSGSRRDMNWIYDEAGAQIQDDACPQNRNRMQVRSRITFRYANGRDDNDNIEPHAGCSVTIEIDLEFDSSTGLLSSMEQIVYDQAALRYDIWNRYDLEFSRTLKDVFGAVAGSSVSDIKL